MITTENFVFETDIPAKRMHIVREFNAPVEKVWKAWTKPNLLEKWWSPKPNVAKTKTMDFTVGGTWLFAMLTPDGNQHWLCVKFTSIENAKLIGTTAVFCDANGNIIEDNKSNWHRKTKFQAIEGNRTKIEIDITFDDEDTMRKKLADGFFQKGTEISYNQLDELIDSGQL